MPDLTPPLDTLYTPGCPRTHSVDQAGLKLKDLPAFASQMLGLKCVPPPRGFTPLLQLKPHINFSVSKCSFSLLLYLVSGLNSSKCCNSSVLPHNPFTPFLPKPAYTVTVTALPSPLILLKIFFTPSYQNLNPK